MTATLTREKYWYSDSGTLLEKHNGTVTVTLTREKILAQWPRHFTREKYWYSVCDFIQGRQLISVRIFQDSWSILVIFVTAALHARPFMNCAFYGSRCNERHILLEGANTKFCPVFYTFCPIRTKFGALNVQENLLNDRGVLWKSAFSMPNFTEVENEFLTALPTFTVRLSRKSDKIIVSYRC